MMVAQGGFDKKEEVENPSEVLLNPSDPEATFRYKAGGRHLGYVGNVVEAVGEKSKSGHCLRLPAKYLRR